MILSSHGHSVIQIGISRTELLKPSHLTGAFERNVCFLEACSYIEDGCFHFSHKLYYTRTY